MYFAGTMFTMIAFSLLLIGAKHKNTADADGNVIYVYR